MISPLLPPSPTPSCASLSDEIIVFSEPTRVSYEVETDEETDEEDVDDCVDEDIDLEVEVVGDTIVEDIVGIEI